ncbi:MAG TPA: hypothetical protein VJ183_13375 [Chloroflexia bacterium]|nr:hypothetical protein [Chloroflexia bacterium]
MGHRLLILGCSARKKGGPEPIPAIERYDGPMWKILRNFAQSEPLLLRGIDILALSAEFGLITGSNLIPLYERKMTPERAVELRPCVVQRLQESLSAEHTDICLAFSKQYTQAIAGWEPLIPSNARLTRTDGPAGVKLAQFKAWLRGEQWVPKGHFQGRLEAPQDAQGWTRVAGVRIEMTRDEVLAIARQNLSDGDAQSRGFRDWYVLVDGERVAPKWLVSVISGQPTSRFDAGDARRVLLQLGVDIEHVTR